MLNRQIYNQPDNWAAEWPIEKANFANVIEWAGEHLFYGKLIKLQTRCELKRGNGER